VPSLEDDTTENSSTEHSLSRSSGDTHEESQMKTEENRHRDSNGPPPTTITTPSKTIPTTGSKQQKTTAGTTTKKQPLQKMTPRDPVFGFAAVHLFFLAVPNLLLSASGRLDKEPLMIELLFGPENKALLCEPGIAKDMFDFVMILLVLYDVAYWRLYLDGPARQPVVLCMGGLGKLLVAGLLARMYYDQHAQPIPIFVLGIVPDFVLGLYFLNAWRRLGFTFSPLIAKGYEV